MKLFYYIKKTYFACISKTIYLTRFKPKFSKILRQKNTCIFFCGNATIGDSVIFLSLIKPFLEKHKDIQTVYYFGKDRTIDSFKELFNGYEDIVVYKRIKDKLAKYMSKHALINISVINYCNRHKDRAFHSMFYLQETIDNGLTVLDYQKKKMGLSQNAELYLPSVPKKKKEKYVVINTSSQTIMVEEINAIAEEAIKYYSDNGFKVYVNGNSRQLKGEYDLVFPNLHEFLELVESASALISIRTGLVDLACATSTNILAIYDDIIKDDYSLKMWPKDDNKKVVEVLKKDFSIALLKDIVKY